MLPQLRHAPRPVVPADQHVDHGISDGGQALVVGFGKAAQKLLPLDLAVHQIEQPEMVRLLKVGRDRTRAVGNGDKVKAVHTQFHFDSSPPSE